MDRASDTGTASPSPLHKRKTSLMTKLAQAGIHKYQLLPLVFMITAGLALSLIIGEVPADVRRAFNGAPLTTPAANAEGAVKDASEDFIMADDTEEIELLKNITSEFGALNDSIVKADEIIAREDEKVEYVQTSASPEVPYALMNPVTLSEEETAEREKIIKANEQAAKERTAAVWCSRVSAGNRNLYLPQYHYGSPALPKNSYGSVAINTQGIPMSDMKMPSSLTFDEYGVPTNYLYCLEGKATAYIGGPGTATGQKVHQGCVAVDPRVIPYGTEMWIVSADGKYIYGYSRAEDTGGFIYYKKGPMVDLYMDTYAECCVWGLRTVKIYILPPSY